MPRALSTPSIASLLSLSACFALAAPAAQAEDLLDQVADSALPIGENRLVSQRMDGRQLNNDSRGGELNADGRFVAFSTRATNADPQDADYNADVYVADLRSGELLLATLGIDGKPSNDESSSFPRPQTISISDDGRYVAFESVATNLVEGDVNAAPDTFVFDRMTGQRQLASGQPDGRPGNGISRMPAISGDGRFVTFHSTATDLTDDGRAGVFVYDVASGTTERVQVGPDDLDAYHPTLDYDGSHLAVSAGPEVYIVDRATGESRSVMKTTDGAVPNGNIWDVAISGNGAYVAYTSSASNVGRGESDDDGDTDVYLTKIADGRARVVSGYTGDGASDQVKIDNRGRSVYFRSTNFGLHNGQAWRKGWSSADSKQGFGWTRMYVYDRLAPRSTTGVCLRHGGRLTHVSCGSSGISGNGKVVGFWTVDKKVVEGDRNQWWDVFVRRVR